ncbi:MAG: hypothetical protein Q8P72_06895 [Candidatus Roizmanbacteria bacterium]|nr:hypothetical protein [Candidatus Roizmanbacteria bacterium]
MPKDYVARSRASFYKELFFAIFLALVLYLVIQPRAVFAAKPAEPRGPYYWCDLENNRVQINWFGSNRATSYAFRIDADPESWNEDCTNSNVGDRCVSLNDTFLWVPIVPLVEYDWWVHGVNQDGYSTAMKGQRFRCEIPLPKAFYFICRNNNTTVDLSWQTQGLPDEYQVRLDANPDSWSGSCGSLNDGDQCLSSTTSHVTFPVEHGVRYKNWVHAIQNTVWAVAVEGPEIQCGFPTISQPAPIIPTRPEIYCHSTDGNDIFTRGSITGNGPGCTGGAVDEFCYNGAVTESYCGGEDSRTCLADILNCPNGCENGACIRQAPTNTPLPLPSDTSTPNETITPNETPGNQLTPTATPPEGGGEECPRFAEGDANCDDIIDVVDYVCWTKEYVYDERGSGCVRTADFDSQEGVALLDFAIWQINFIKENNL